MNRSGAGLSRAFRQGKAGKAPLLREAPNAGEGEGNRAWSKQLWGKTTADTLWDLPHRLCQAQLRSRTTGLTEGRPGTAGSTRSLRSGSPATPPPCKAKASISPGAPRGR